MNLAEVSLRRAVSCDRVDSEDDLSVTFGSAEVGERPGEFGDDCTAAGGVPASVGVVAVDDELSGVGVGVGVGVDGAGVSSESFGAGGHDGDIAVGDPLDRRAAQRPRFFLYAESHGGSKLPGTVLDDCGDGVGVGDKMMSEGVVELAPDLSGATGAQPSRSGRVPMTVSIYFTHLYGCGSSAATPIYQVILVQRQRTKFRWSEEEHRRAPGT